ncbi:MAG: hypothetical protein JO115_00515 [Pseudonocardiales bacterium]|nr:hypothetical protein [Pseudonocardiales bacterium]
MTPVAATAQPALLTLSWRMALPGSEVTCSITRALRDALSKTAQFSVWEPIPFGQDTPGLGRV